MNLVNSSNFKKKVLESNKPVLLAYIRQFFDYGNQAEIILKISSSHGHALKVCIVDEEDSMIMNILGIIGSPTYFIFSQGDEIKRTLGVHEPASLFSFVSGI